MTVAIPTRDRPELLRRALGSVVGATAIEPTPADVEARVEIVVSDNSADPDDDRTETIVQQLVVDWPGPTRYLRHRPSIDRVANVNACLRWASGEFVQVLHDDDYLLPGGLQSIVENVAETTQQVLLFGARIVDRDEHVRRRQSFRRRKTLRPADALQRVLASSSFVRFPALVVSRRAYEQVGLFDHAVGAPTTFDMWVRLLSRFGVECVPGEPVAYTARDDSLAASTIRPETIDTMLEIFDRVRRTRLLDASTLARCRAEFFHHFILGGAWRSLRAGDRAQARRLLGLFDHPGLRGLDASPRWFAVRGAFELLTIGAHSAPPNEPAARETH